MKEYKIKAGAAAAVLFAVFMVLFINGKKGTENETLQTDTAGIVEEETAAEPLPVSKEEEELLSGLYRAMEQRRLTDAAEILNENEEQFKILVQETLAGEKYCYYEETAGEDGQELHRMEVLRKDGEQKGMVITRYNTAFFGGFSDGAPEGDCVAIQAMVLQEPRYTYAAGKWTAGKMNGEGKTGYCYYENAPESGFVMMEKAGVYENNLLNGSFTCRTENRDGECLHWEMEAESGVTVLTGGWTYYGYRNEYMLPSVEDSARAYVLKEEQTGAVLWNNLILWDE